MGIIKKGTKFRKSGSYDSVFVVDKILNFDLPHVRLVEVDGNCRTITIAESALLDIKHWIILE